MSRNKIKCELTLDLETGEYQARFINVSKPGDDIEYDKALNLIKRIVDKLSKDCEEKSDDPQIIKLIH